MENKKEIALNEELIQKISGHIRVGADFMLATAACRVPEAQAEIWLQKMETNRTGVFLELFEEIRAAKAFAEVIALQRLSAEGGASGAKWLLEKLNPEKYKKNKAKTIENPKKNEKVEPSSEAGHSLIEDSTAFWDNL